MAVEQHDKDYGERTMTRVIVVIGALIGVGVCILPNVESGPKISTAGYVLIAIWSAILVAGVIWGTRIQRRYHCSKCGTHLPRLRTEAATRYQHRFHCKACDIIWTTDVHEGD